MIIYITVTDYGTQSHTVCICR